MSRSQAGQPDWAHRYRGRGQQRDAENGMCGEPSGGYAPAKHRGRQHNLIPCEVMKIAYDLSLYFMFRNVSPPGLSPRRRQQTGDVNPILERQITGRRVGCHRSGIAQAYLIPTRQRSQATA